MVYIIQVRQTLQRQKELKMAKLHPKEPPKPKEITVIAGTYFYAVKILTRDSYTWPGIRNVIEYL